MDEDTGAFLFVAILVIIAAITGYGVYTYTRSINQGPTMWSFKHASAQTTAKDPIFLVHNTAVMNVSPITGNLKTYILSHGL